MEARSPFFYSIQEKSMMLEALESDDSISEIAGRLSKKMCRSQKAIIQKLRRLDWKNPFVPKQKNKGGNIVRTEVYSDHIRLYFK